MAIIKKAKSKAAVNSTKRKRTGAARRKAQKRLGKAVFMTHA